MLPKLVLDRRRCAMLASAAFFLLATGCSWLGRAPALAPGGFAQAHPAAALTDPARMSREYQKLFPARNWLRVSNADLTVERRWLSISKPLVQLFSLAADDQGQLRLRISNAHLTTPLVDLARSTGSLAVAMAEEAGKQAVFTGPVEAGEESPFGRALGVEPQDLRRSLLIGERVWRDHWRAAKHWRTIELTPFDGKPFADGLLRIDLDRKTGLPIDSDWRRGDKVWRVQYEAWGWYRSDSGPKLMPARLSVKPDHPAVTLALAMNDPDSYPDYVPGVEKSFVMRIGDNAEIYPLDRLDRALAEMLKQ